MARWWNKLQKDLKEEVVDPVADPKQHFRANKVFSSKYVLLPSLAVLYTILFFTANYLTNIILDLFGNLRHLSETGVSVDFGIGRAFQFSSALWIWYLVLAAALLLLCGKLWYDIRVNFKPLDVGHKADSRWTTRREIKAQFKAILKEIDHTGPLNPEDFYSGGGGFPVAQDDHHLYIDTTPVNNLILGMTRSGKGVYILKIQLELYSRAEYQPSFIVTDPKLELASSSIEMLQDRGYEVHALNLINMEESMGYNPLQSIIDAYRIGDIPKAVDLCDTLSTSIYKSEKKNNSDTFWEDSSIAALNACILSHVEDCLQLDQEANQAAQEQYDFGRKLFDSMTPKQQAATRILFQVRERYHEDMTVSEVENFYKENHIPHDDTTAQKCLNILRVNAKKDSMTNRKIANELELEIETVKKIIAKRHFDCVLPETPPPKETHEHEKNINMYSIIQTFRKLGSIWLDDRTTELDRYFARRPDNNPAKMQYAAVQMGGDKTKSSVFITTLTGIKTFSNINVARLTAESTVNLESVGFGEKPVAIFLGLPYSDRSKDFLATLFISQLTFALSDRCSRTRGNKCDREVVFLLDEIGNLPPIDNLEQLVSVGLGQNLRFNLFIQSYAQLKKNYGEGATTIIDNCGNQVYLLTNGTESAKIFSEMLGKKTITTVSRSGKKFSLSKTQTESTEEVPLMYPEQLNRLQEGEFVLVRSTHRRDLQSNSIPPTPILNTGKYRFTPYYQYLSKFFTDDKLLSELHLETRRDIDPNTRVFDANAYLKKARVQDYLNTLVTKSNYGNLLNDAEKDLLDSLGLDEKQFRTMTVGEYMEYLTNLHKEEKLNDADFNALYTPLDTEIAVIEKSVA